MPDLTDTPIPPGMGIQKMLRRGMEIADGARMTALTLVHGRERDDLFVHVARCCGQAAVLAFAVAEKVSDRGQRERMEHAWQIFKDALEAERKAR